MTPDNGGRRRVLPRDRVSALCAHALEHGGVRQSLTQVHWDISGDCETPVILELEGRESAPRHDPEWGSNIRWFRDQFWFEDLMPQGFPLALVMETKCRKCEPCLKARAYGWRIRAEAEINAAPRTWFGTLTLAPEAYSRALMQAERQLGKGGSRYGDLSASEQFKAVHAEISKDITRYIKRIRKESGVTLRYILVAEAHKTGVPHYHCLFHEASWQTVGERTLRRQWILGFSKFVLVRDKQTARYVTKYLAKAAMARVRASVRYGETALSPS